MLKYMLDETTDIIDRPRTPADQFIVRSGGEITRRKDQPTGDRDKAHHDPDRASLRKREADRDLLSLKKQLLGRLGRVSNGRLSANGIEHHVDQSSDSSSLMTAPTEQHAGEDGLNGDDSSAEARASVEAMAPQVTAASFQREVYGRFRNPTVDETLTILNELTDDQKAALIADAAENTSELSGPVLLAIDKYKYDHAAAEAKKLEKEAKLNERTTVEMYGHTVTVTDQDVAEKSDEVFAHGESEEVQDEEDTDGFDYEYDGGAFSDNPGWREKLSRILHRQKRRFKSRFGQPGILTRRKNEGDVRRIQKEGYGRPNSGKHRWSEGSNFNQYQANTNRRAVEAYMLKQDKKEFLTPDGRPNIPIEDESMTPESSVEPRKWVTDDKGFRKQAGTRQVSTEQARKEEERIKREEARIRGQEKRVTGFGREPGRRYGK